MLLIQPALPHLAGVRLLRIVPDGALRYIPFAALHEGHLFLIQRWALVHVSTAEAREPPSRPRHEWRVAAFGITALEDVSRELQAVREAAPALVLLDDAFTRDALAMALRERFDVPHIASHFRVDPASGDPARRWIWAAVKRCCWENSEALGLTSAAPPSWYYRPATRVWRRLTRTGLTASRDFSSCAERAA